MDILRSSSVCSSTCSGVYLGIERRERLRYEHIIRKGRTSRRSAVASNMTAPFLFVFARSFVKLNGCAKHDRIWPSRDRSPRYQVQCRIEFRQSEAKRHRDQFAARPDRARAAHPPDDK